MGENKAHLACVEEVTAWMNLFGKGIKVEWWAQTFGQPFIYQIKFTFFPFAHYCKKNFHRFMGRKKGWCGMYGFLFIETLKFQFGTKYNYLVNFYLDIYHCNRVFDGAMNIFVWFNTHFKIHYCRYTLTYGIKSE